MVTNEVVNYNVNECSILRDIDDIRNNLEQSIPNSVSLMMQSIIGIKMELELIVVAHPQRR